MAFFYLWRIATLLFDLVFVWHRYVRHSAARDAVWELTTQGHVPSPTEAVAARFERAHRERRARPAEPGPSGG